MPKDRRGRGCSVDTENNGFTEAIDQYYVPGYLEVHDSPCLRVALHIEVSWPFLLKKNIIKTEICKVTIK